MSCAVVALLVTLIVGVQGHQIIFVDTENGMLNSSCWEGGLDQPCGSLELANTGAQRYNSTIAVLYRYTRVQNTSQTSSYLPLHNTGNVTYGCGSTISTCNESVCNNQKCTSVSVQTSNAPCPPWFESSNGTCKCVESIDSIVKCDQVLQESSVLECYCMTYNESTGTVIGACFHNCVRDALKAVVYRLMPKSVEQLNHAVCGDFNRDGQLCGECKANYSPPVYSYDLHCTMCSGGLYNWVKYVAIAFLPLTVFLFLVLCCRISATSPKLYAFVTFSQALAFPANVRVLLLAFNGNFYPCASIALRIASTLYGFWNLDFFRSLISHQICLNVDTLQALALDYGIAFYPLALIIITYVLIELHTYNIRCIVWIWRPFHVCFARFRQQWDIRTSVIDAFATFLLLSNVKLLSVSLDLLIPTCVHNVNRSLGFYLYYDASIQYFGTEKHLPYAITAVCVVLTFVVFPILLLLLYPMRCFQWCLGRCRVRWHALHIFIDSFQGYYKDGTNGTRDCRYFAGVYLLVRLLLCILFAVTRSAVYYGVAFLVLIGVAMLIAIVQPYKVEFGTYNTVDSVFILTLAMWCGTVLCISIAVEKAHYLVEAFAILSFLVGTLPLFYLVVIILCWICSCRGVGQRLVGRIKSQIGGMYKQVCCIGLEESLPDRLINPHFYHDYPMTERFSDQTYSNISNEESTMTS